MTDFCTICLTEAVSLDDWYLKTKPAHGKIAIIECVCPWCVQDMMDANRSYLELDGCQYPLETCTCPTKDWKC